MKKVKKKAVKKVNHLSVDRLAKFEVAWATKQTELINKHNEIATNVAALEAIIKNLSAAMATEVGKIHATIDAHMQALSGLDLNILASAEVLKECILQLGLLYSMVGKLGPCTLSPEETETVNTNTDQWFKTLVSKAFETVKKRLEKEALEQREVIQKAKEQAQTEMVEQVEAMTMKSELKKAETEVDRIVSNISGGPGHEYPDGAEIFGG